MQGSTAGYFGIYDFQGLPTLLSNGMPDSIPATYTVHQPESNVVDLIELGGAGLRADGNNQTMMHDKTTFEDPRAVVLRGGFDGWFSWFVDSDCPPGRGWHGVDCCSERGRLLRDP